MILRMLRNIQKQYTAKTLSEFAGEPKPTPATQTEFPLPLSDAGSDLAFFSTLNFVLPFCPPDPSEQELVTRLARIGVVAGEPYDVAAVSPEIQEALTKGMAEGEAAITAAAAKLKVAEVIGTRDYLGSDYLIKRAVAAKLGRYTNSKEEALYPLYLSDAEGKPLDGSAGKLCIEDRIGRTATGQRVLVHHGLRQPEQRTGCKSDQPISNQFVHDFDSLNRDADGGLTFSIQFHVSGRRTGGQLVTGAQRPVLHGHAFVLAEAGSLRRHVDAAVGLGS